MLEDNIPRKVGRPPGERDPIKMLERELADTIRLCQRTRKFVEDQLQRLMDNANNITDTMNIAKITAEGTKLMEATVRSAQALMKALDREAKPSEADESPEDIMKELMK